MQRSDRYRTGGDLDGFGEIARLAVGNSRLELLLCFAFVGPVAAMLELKQPAVMLVGPAEAGKSTALVAAGSVWGRHVDPNMANKLGFCLPFNATDNDLEDEALAANHTLLAVDETRSAAGGDEREVAKFLVGLVMRWELGFENENAIGKEKNVGRGGRPVTAPSIHAPRYSTWKSCADREKVNKQHPNFYFQGRGSNQGNT